MKFREGQIVWFPHNQFELWRGKLVNRDGVLMCKWTVDVRGHLVNNEIYFNFDKYVKDKDCPYKVFINNYCYE